jgi:hypothetical protein
MPDPFSLWLQQLVDRGELEITGNKKDFLTLKKLNEYYARQCNSSVRMDIGHVQSFFTNHKENVKVWVNDTPIKVNGHSVRRPIIGIKFSI